MYEDNYAECYVKAKRTPASYLLLVGLVLLVTFSLVFTIVFTWGFVALAIAVGVCYFTYPYLKVDYEYILVQGEIRVARIYSGSLRKKGAFFDLSEVRKIEPVTREEIAEKKNQMSALIEDFSSRYENRKLYAAEYQKGGRIHLFVFEPDEAFLNYLYKTSPSKVTK